MRRTPRASPRAAENLLCAPLRQPRRPLRLTKQPPSFPRPETGPRSLEPAAPTLRNSPRRLLLNWKRRGQEKPAVVGRASRLGTAERRHSCRRKLRRGEATRMPLLRNGNRNGVTRSTPGRGRSAHGLPHSAHGLAHPAHGFGKTEGGRPPQNHGKRCFLVFWGVSSLVQPPSAAGTPSRRRRDDLYARRPTRRSLGANFNVKVASRRKYPPGR